MSNYMTSTQIFFECCSNIFYSRNEDKQYIREMSICRDCPNNDVCPILRVGDKV